MSNYGCTLRLYPSFITSKSKKIVPPERGYEIIYLYQLVHEDPDTGQQHTLSTGTPEAEIFKNTVQLLKKFSSGKGRRMNLDLFYKNLQVPKSWPNLLKEPPLFTYPKSLVERWTQSHLLGFDAIIEIGNGDALKILVEKDFRCLNARDEENNDV